VTQARQQQHNTLCRHSQLQTHAQAGLCSYTVCDAHSWSA
jgi:hypothetical protein